MVLPGECEEDDIISPAMITFDSIKFTRGRYGSVDTDRCDINNGGLQALFLLTQPSPRLSLPICGHSREETVL